MRADENGVSRMLAPREAADIAGELDEDDFEARLEGVCVKWVADEAEPSRRRHSCFATMPSGSWSWSWTGWQLVDPVDGGHGLMVNEDPEKRVSDRD